MNVFVQGPKRLLVFNKGESLTEALSAYDGPGALRITGAGALTDIELEDADGRRRKVGAAEALSVQGVVVGGEVVIYGTFLRGSQALGGRIRAAKVVRCVFHGEEYEAAEPASDSMSDSFIRSTAIKATVTKASNASRPAQSQWEEDHMSWGQVAAASEQAEEQAKAPAFGSPETAPAKTAPAKAAMNDGWAAAIAASEEATQVERQPTRKKRAPRFVAPHVDVPPSQLRSAKSRAKLPDYLDEPVPEVGDYVDHKQFGLCLVKKVGDDGGLLLKLESGRTKLIKLTVLKVLPARKGTKRTIYPLVKRN